MLRCAPLDRVDGTPRARCRPEQREGAEPWSATQLRRFAALSATAPAGSHSPSLRTGVFSGMPGIDPHFVLSVAELTALRTQRHAVPVDDVVFRIQGRGAIDILQGLLTNDVSKLGIGQAIWGAFLTPKGMIVSDTWILRDGLGAWILVPRTIQAIMQEVFARSVPPRLATVTDCSDQQHVDWLIGPAPTEPIPSTFTPIGPAPFTALLLRSDATPELPAGWPQAPQRFADACCLLNGWPVMGREIDQRTLPQEVRFDALGGVRYDKGCYTGQETVARLHFRGHTNRSIRGIGWAPGDSPDNITVTDGEKDVGTLRTIGRVADRVLALAMLRSTVATGDTVRAGASEGVVVELPFDLGELAVA